MGEIYKTHKLCWISFHFIFLVLLSIIICSLGHEDTSAPYPKRTSNYKADFILGGLFPVHVHEKNSTKCSKVDSTYRFLTTAMGYVDCHRLNVFGLMWVEAMLFTIAEINNRTDILPNITLGYDIRDSANNVHNALNASLDFVLPNYQKHITTHKQNRTDYSLNCTCRPLKNHQVCAVIGGAGSKISKAVNTILGINYIPQISYSSTSPSLSDKTYFPSFLRTIPPDYIQAQVMADLVSYFKWTYVSAVATDEDYGRLGIEAFKQEVKTRNVCISVDELFHPNNDLPETKTKISHIVGKLKNDKRATVVVLFCESPNALAVLEEAERQGLTGKIWIGAEAWGDKKTVLPFKSSTVGGMLGVLPWKGNIDQFERHMSQLTPLMTGHNPWFTEYWKGNFGCKYGSHKNAKTTTQRINKTGNSTYRNESNHELNPSLNDTVSGKSELKCSKFRGEGRLPTAVGIQLNKAPNVMDSVYAVARALHKMLNCTSGPLNVGSCSKRNLQVVPRDLLGYIKNLSFTGKLGYPVKFDKHGDTKGNYLIKSLQPDNTSTHGKSFVTIGNWSWLERKLVIENTTISWNSGSTQVPFSRCSIPCSRGEYPVQGGVPCCWTCVNCRKGFIKNVTGPGKCLKCPKGFSSYIDHSKCLKLPEIYLRWDASTSVVILVMSGLGIVLTVFVTCVFLRYGGTAIVKASTREFSLLMLLIITLMFALTSLYIGRPTDTLCKIRPFCFGFVITFWTSLMLTKTNRLLMIFKSKGVPSRDAILGICLQLILALFLTLIVTATTLVWITSLPPKVTYHYFETRVMIDCGDDSRKLLMIILGYTAVLAATTTFLAYKARNLPENFNETRLIGFSMFTFCVIWLTFIPLFYGTDPAIKYVFLCFSLDVTGFSTLICMFTSRLRIILFHPEKNRTAIVRASMFTYTMRDRTGSSATDTATARHLRRTSVVTVGNLTLPSPFEYKQEHK